MLEKIKIAFRENRIRLSDHVIHEMEFEEFGVIKLHEMYEVIKNGEVIENYPDDKPYPSCLIYGKTNKERPIHICVAYCEDKNLAIPITIYQPNPEIWLDYKVRRK